MNGKLFQIKTIKKLIDRKNPFPGLAPEETKKTSFT